jgi:predicted transposase/invertase (TIGR01784 family)
MKRDTIFYQIFQRSPQLLFDLLPLPPASTQGYSFESVEIKEASFRIDGVLTPPDPSGDVFFVEVQMQPNPKLNERMFNEISTYTYRRTEMFEDWRAVILYPSRSVEQTTTKVPYELFASGRIRPIYLDTLGQISQLPVGLGLMVLTTLEGDVAISEARDMISRSRQSLDENAIIELVSTIILYKFTTLNRDEVAEMLGYKIDDLKQSRVYQDARQEGREEGREEERRDVVLMLLAYKFGQISSLNLDRVQALKFDRLQELSTAILDFTSLADLEAWLQS